MTDLDTALRSMLRERANDIDSLPADFADLASLDVLDHDPIHDRSRHRTGWLIAAVIAAVLGVVGTAVTLRANGGHGRGSAATHTPTATNTTSAPVPGPVQRTACTTALPAAWRSALTAGTSHYGASSVLPLAVSPDGSAMLVARDYGTSRDVALVRRDGAARSIYSVPQPDKNQVTTASLDNRYAVLDLSWLPRDANGVIPSDREVVLINRANGSTKTLDRVTDNEMFATPQGRTIDGSLLWNGHVYWDVRTSYGSRTSTIRDYDLSTGRTTVAGHGKAGPPRLLADGVTFDGYGGTTVAIPRELPVAVATANRDRANPLVSDGPAYAWTTKGQLLAWWAPGQSRVTTFALPAYADPHAEAVAGPFVLLDDSRSATAHRLLLDARDRRDRDPAAGPAVLPQRSRHAGRLRVRGVVQDVGDGRTPPRHQDTARALVLMPIPSPACRSLSAGPAPLTSPPSRGSSTSTPARDASCWPRSSSRSTRTCRTSWSPKSTAWSSAAARCTCSGPISARYAR